MLQIDGEPLVIADQALVAGTPAQAALDHPAAWQQYEAAFGVAQLDHLQVDAALLGRLRGHFTRVALVGIGQRNALAGRNKCLFNRLLDE